MPAGMQTPSPPHALSRIRPGTRFEFTSRSGRGYVCTLIYQGSGVSGLIVRYDGSRRLGRLDPNRVLRDSLVVQGGREPVLHPGDEVLVRTPSQRLRGVLAAPVGEEVAVERRGRTLRVGVRQVTGIELWFPVTGFCCGDDFAVQSLSGNHYTGRVLELGPGGRRFRGRLGDSREEVWLRVSRLEPNSLFVPVPVSIHDA